MPDDFVTATARKWCWACRAEGQRMDALPDDVHVHDDIAAAIRETLEEVETMAKETIPYDMPVSCPDGIAGCCVQHTVLRYRRRSPDEIALGIAALRETP